MDIYKLGIEELAAGIKAVGDPESAIGILTANFGELNTEEKRGRFLAANHSLMAKGLISLEKGAWHIQNEFERAMKMLIQYDFSLRLNFGEGIDEQIMAFYFRDKQILKHVNLQGVAHHLSWAGSLQQVVQDGIRFLGFDQYEVFDCPKVEIRQHLLEDAKKKAVSHPEKVLSSLKNAGVPEIIMERLSDDLIHSDFRGSVLRVERENRKMVSNHGFLVMIRKPRAWIFPVFLKNDEPYSRILAGNESTFQAEILTLIN